MLIKPDPQRSKAIVIICSRPESSRIYRKPFQRVGGKPLIEHILWRLKDIPYRVCLAVPSQCEDYDDMILKYRGAFGSRLFIYKGYSESPLHRMAAVLQLHSDAKYVVRVTHDDPLIDVPTMLAMIDEAHLKDVGYMNCPGILEGAGVEVIARENVLSAARTLEEPTEYVSYFVKDFPNKKNIQFEPRLSIKRRYRLTIDYPKDLQALETVFRTRGSENSLDEYAAFIDENPWIKLINYLPAVSVYTCAYNAQDTIEETMRTVLNSTCTDFEYIIVDDHSTDGTLTEIAKYCGDRRVRVHMNQENVGLAASSNKAISLARAPYVMRVDADDRIYPLAIGKLEEEIKDRHATVVYPCFNEVSPSGEKRIVLTPQDFHHAGCAIMDRRILNEIRFKEELRHWDGLELYKRIALRGGIHYLMEPLFFYRRRNGSMSMSDTRERARIKDDIFKS